MILQVKLVTIFILASNSLSKGSPSNSSLFQCQASTQQSGEVFMPNIPDFHFDHSNVASASQGDQPTLTTLPAFRLYILTLPPLSVKRNCNGSVISFEYCYIDRQTSLGKKRPIFSFLPLIQNGFQYTVDGRVSISSTSSNTTCSNSTSRDMACCDVADVEVEDINIPASGHTIGLVMRRRIPAFSEADEQYQTENFQQFVGSFSTSRGSIFNLTEENSISGFSLPLLRFVIDPDVILSPTSTPEVLENNIPSSESVSEASDNDGSRETTTMISISLNTTSDSLAIFVGATIGAASALLCITALVLTAVTRVCLLRKRRIRKERMANLHAYASIHYPNEQAIIKKPPALPEFNMNTNASYSVSLSLQTSVIKLPESPIYCVPDNVTPLDDYSCSYYELVD